MIRFALGRYRLKWMCNARGTFEDSKWVYIYNVE